MSDSSSDPRGNENKFNFYGRVQADKQIIGDYGQIVENQIVIQVITSDNRVQTLEGSREDPRLQQPMQFFRQGNSQKRELADIGANPDIIAPAPSDYLTHGSPSSAGMGASVMPLAGRSPSASLYGGFKPQPIQASTSDLERLANNFPQLASLLHQLDQQFHGSIQEVTVNEKPLDVVKLLIQQGNLALWRFRQASSRLFGQNVTATFLAQLEWPAPPQMEAINAQARNNIEVLRGIAFAELLAPQYPELINPSINQLAQGQWRQVLDDWERRKVLDREMIQQARTAVEAIGQPYRPDEVRVAVQEAEKAFQEAFQRHPGNTTAIVSLAILKAESALFFYIETGTVDRDRLKSAHALFDQGRTLLTQRQDHDSKIDLGKCLLYASVSLPQDADLESISWVKLQTQLMRASFTQQGQLGIRWDIAQRNFAHRGEPRFYNDAGILQAHDLFMTAGEIALADQCTKILQSLQQTRNTMQWNVQQMQMAAPFVGTWEYTGGNMLVRSSGRLVFDSLGFFHWLNNTAVNLIGQKKRIISIGRYQVMDNVIILEGNFWNIQPQSFGMPFISTVPIYFSTQIIVQGQTSNQLMLFEPKDGIQVQCQRL